MCVYLVFSAGWIFRTMLSVCERARLVSISKGSMFAQSYTQAHTNTHSSTSRSRTQNNFFSLRFVVVFTPPVMYIHFGLLFAALFLLLLLLLFQNLICVCVCLHLSPACLFSHHKTPPKGICVSALSTCRRRFWFSQMKKKRQKEKKPFLPRLFSSSS